ncbi:nuclease HARBI1-like protein [Aphelenchoides avenae]|nr:nuclease HARBI1-like protein [Aphelenchus avenae]
MDIATFQLLLEKIAPRLTKSSRRTPTSPEERLVVTLRFLSGAGSFRSLSYSFRLGVSTIAVIVKETCEAIYEELHAKYLRAPNTPNEWLEIANGFWERWKCPNTLGCMDGKHIAIKKPPKSGSMYFNYKGFFSTVLMGVCDHRYRLICVDVGAYGSESDGGVFDRSLLRARLLRGELNLPEPDFLPGNGNTVSPFFFIGDAAFPLMTNLMKPFPGQEIPAEQRTYNYRMCSTRRIIENVFGILAAKWRVLLKPLETSDQKGKKTDSGDKSCPRPSLSNLMHAVGASMPKLVLYGTP